MSCRFVKVCVCLELEREETLDSFVNRLEQPGLAQDEEIEEMLPDIASWREPAEELKTEKRQGRWLGSVYLGWHLVTTCIGIIKLEYFSV